MFVFFLTFFFHLFSSMFSVLRYSGHDIVYFFFFFFFFILQWFLQYIDMNQPCMYMCFKPHTYCFIFWYQYEYRILIFSVFKIYLKNWQPFFFLVGCSQRSFRFTKKLIRKCNFPIYLFPPEHNFTYLLFLLECHLFQDRDND